VLWLRNCLDRGRRPYVLHCVQTGSEAHPASSLLNDYRGCFHRSEATALSPCAEVKKKWVADSSLAHVFISCTRTTLFHTWSHNLFMFSFFLLRITKAAGMQDRHETAIILVPLSTEWHRKAFLSLSVVKAMPNPHNRYLQGVS